MKKLTIILILILVAVMVVGCGKEEELLTFEEWEKETFEEYSKTKECNIDEDCVDYLWDDDNPKACINNMCEFVECRKDYNCNYWMIKSMIYPNDPRAKFRICENYKCMDCTIEEYLEHDVEE